MNVPEIRDMVALHLRGHTRRYLAVCSRVCKDWHATFMPFLYRSLLLRDSAHYNSFLCAVLFPSPEVLQAYGHLVKELDLQICSTRSHFVKGTVAALRNLDKLSVCVPERRSKEVDWLSLRPLLVNNRGIRSLSISCISHPNSLSHIVENCTSHLTILLLGTMEIEWSQLLHVLDNCRQLSTLECRTCTFIGSLKQIKETAWPAITNLKDLRLLGSSGNRLMPLVDWVKMCPRLEKLTVKYDRMTRLGPVSLFSPGPQLSSLNLDCRLLTDDELAEVLARCTALKELTLERASITREVFGALSGHFGSLVSLNLSAVPRMEQWLLKQISENCPRLVELFMAHLDVNTFYNPALDEQDDQPWACRETLRKLLISTIQMSLDASLNDRFMKQLKHLKRLENFITAATYRGDGSTRILDAKDVPGDTPEAQLLTKLCKSRVYVLWPSDVELDPRWKWITDVWPKLSYFNFGSEAADDDDDDHDAGEFYDEYDSDDYNYDYDYDYRDDYL